MYFLSKGNSYLKYGIIELVLLYIVAYLARPNWIISENLWDIPKNHYYTWVSSFFLIIFVLYFMKLTSLSCFRDEFYIPKFKVRYFFDSILLYLKFLLVLLFFFIVSVIIFYLLPNSFFNYIQNKGFKFQWKISSKLSVFLMIITSFFVGVSEELIYRAFIITKLKKIGLSSIFSLIISSSIFAIGHIYYGFYGLFVTFFIACIFGFIYLKFKNIYYVIFIHSFHNIWAAILLFFYY